MTHRHDHDGTDDRLLTAAETMSRLNVSRRTLDRYEDAGLLTPKRLPTGHRRFSSAQVEALLAEKASA